MAEPLSHSSMAAEYALVGDLDSAFRHLETAVAEHNVSLQLIRNEPTLEPLRRDPRFKAILKKMNLG